MTIDNHEDRVTVRLGLRDRGAADGPAGPAPVFDYKGLIQALGQFLRDEPRASGVKRAAGGVAHQLYYTAWIMVFGRNWLKTKHDCKQSNCPQQDYSASRCHGLLPLSPNHVLVLFFIDCRN